MEIQAQIGSKFIRQDGDGYYIFALPLRVYLQGPMGEPPNSPAYPFITIDYGKDRRVVVKFREAA